MSEVPTTTLQSWRDTLDAGYKGTQKPRSACKIVRDAIDAILAVPPVVVPPVTEPPVVPIPPSALAPSGPIVLPMGDKTLANLHITSSNKGIVGNNDVKVGTLTCNNVKINSTNYGVYLGDADGLIANKLDITCSPTGGDSYSVRGFIRSIVSTDSTYRSGIKAWRVYGLLTGTSTRDTFTGDRVMLGGGAADEWVSPQVFENCRFTDGRFDVNSIEIYAATHHVAFDGCDFAGTGHISIITISEAVRAHHITFTNCKNMPEVKYFNANGRYTTSASELAARGITFA